MLYVLSNPHTVPFKIHHILLCLRLPSGIFKIHMFIRYTTVNIRAIFSIQSGSIFRSNRPIILRQRINH